LTPRLLGLLLLLGQTHHVHLLDLSHLPRLLSQLDRLDHLKDLLGQ
jgi:hypothetical protein